jgi:hypothetical protein
MALLDSDIFPPGIYRAPTNVFIPTLRFDDDGIGSSLYYSTTTVQELPPVALQNIQFPSIPQPLQPPRYMESNADYYKFIDEMIYPHLREPEPMHRQIVKKITSLGSYIFGGGCVMIRSLGCV